MLNTMTALGLWKANGLALRLLYMALVTRGFPPPRIAQVIVGRHSSLFLIHLPLTVANLR